MTENFNIDMATVEDFLAAFEPDFGNLPIGTVIVGPVGVDRIDWEEAPNYPSRPTLGGADVAAGLRKGILTVLVYLAACHRDVSESRLAEVQGQLEIVTGPPTDMERTQLRLRRC